eukprot:TRINITY_DN2080_c0_g1_i1.p1 TRINITY_DN2080_c0_g1~~TRINITY_DN2080_c0_g1_i1.p1  ORF type:complete len:286 (+),score=43.33 TRINITY_DN2080_c0_g1_i1:56-913(+)
MSFTCGFVARRSIVRVMASKHISFARVHTNRVIADESSASIAKSQETIVNLCKRRGFIYQSFEPYNGLSNCYDYGPLGSLMKRNLQEHWWKCFVSGRLDCVGVDTTILTHPQVLVASKHVENFSDPVAECKSCHKRFRADHLVEKWIKAHPDQSIQEKSNAAYSEFIKTKGIKCPHCQAQDFTDVNSFHLMFQTHMGAVEGSGSLVYLRPETAQGIFMNFEHAMRVSRKSLPFGISCFSSPIIYIFTREIFILFQRPTYPFQTYCYHHSISVGVLLLYHHFYGGA